jgi:hypothetical protein
MNGLRGSSSALPQGRSGRSDGHVRPHKGMLCYWRELRSVTMINFAEPGAHDFFPNWVMRFGCLAMITVTGAESQRRRERYPSNPRRYCGLLVVVELVVLPPLLGSISVFEWVSELPAEPCL